MDPDGLLFRYFGTATIDDLATGARSAGVAARNFMDLLAGVEGMTER